MQQELDRFDYLEFPNDYELPDGYLYDQLNHQIYRYTKFDDIESVISAPIFIARRYIDAETDHIFLTLAFYQIDKLKTMTVPRSWISSTGKILKLSDYGLPVHSGNARKLIDYLHDFEAINQHHIPTQSVYHSNGWKTFDGQPLFIAGEQVVCSSQERPNIVFRTGAGFEHLGGALHQEGSFEIWKETIREAMIYPKVAFAVYCSFAAPLLSLVNAPNFVVHYWGRTSVGKTTTLSVASSVWGRPEQEAGGLIMPWNTTSFYVEQTATFMNDLPIFKDDCQATDDSLLSHALYMIANRVGKGRGDKGGSIKASPSWQTICLSTGEKKLSETTTFHGVKARTIELEGSPFDDRLPELVNQLKMTLRGHYGHAGPVFLRSLLANLNRQELQQRYIDKRNALSMIATDEISDRMTHYFAIVWLSAELVEQYLGLTSNYDVDIPQLFQSTTQQKEEKLSNQALKGILDFVQQNNRYIAGKEGFAVTQNERWGVWKERKYLALKREVLVNALESQGFNANEVFDVWEREGWLKRDGRQRTYTISFKGKTQKMMVIKWHAIDSSFNQV